MPIPNPILDDRSYQQLRDELVHRIPVYTPEWTDHNASDPGITLIELFAFLGENLLYRFNQIPEQARLEFLRLLQIPLRPATPSRALVAMTTQKAAGILIEKETEFKAGAISFSAEDETHVWPVSVVAVGRIAAAEPDKDAEPEVFQFAVNAVQALGTLPRDHVASFYENKIVTVDGPPVDFNKTVDGKLWIAILKEKEFQLDEFKPAPNSSPILNIGFTRDAVFPKMDEVSACPGASAETDQNAVEWRISTPNDKPDYLTLKLVGDTTGGLSRDGVVRLEFPADSKAYGPFAIDDPDKHGSGDFPPALDDEKEKKILCWICAYRKDGLGFGKLQFIGANATFVSQTRRAQVEFLGTGSAQPSQSYALQNQHAIPGTVRVQLEDGPRWIDWTEVDSFHDSHPDSRHFTLDSEAGRVTFGSGEQGAAPQIGQRIRVNGYRFGGGRQGNVAAKAISKAPAFPDVKASNPLSARGGSDSESIREGLSRIPDELRRRYRAVTASDFQELALQTPGADLGRAECLARFHPPSKSQNAAGVVTVVVWPREDPLHPSAPVPDAALLRMVCRWLDGRRLVTTELYVVPPTYRKVAVSIGFEVKPGFGVEAVRRWIELVVRQYLAPLPPYGPEGGGWPLGKQVYGPELEAAALQVEGVQYLHGSRVAFWDVQQWKEGVAALAPYEVPELAEISVVQGQPVQDPWQPVASPVKTVPVPIPIIRDKC